MNNKTENTDYQLMPYNGNIHILETKHTSQDEITETVDWLTADEFIDKLNDEIKDLL